MLVADKLFKTVALGDQTIPILKGIDLEIKPGESIAILGASGSGKSTLLGLLAGLDTPTSGRVSHSTFVISEADEDARAIWRGQEVGFVFQSFQLLPSLTALDNVALPAQLAGRSAAQAQALAMHQLQRVGLEARVKHFPKQLSGGEQQRVAIARAFVTHPNVLFADEPTGNLDESTGAYVADLLFSMTESQGKTLVLVTHDPDLAGRCQRLVRIQNGLLEAVE